MRVEDYDIDFEELLSAAEDEAKNEWEMDFVGDMRDKYTDYGDTMFLSEKQLALLRRIAKDV
jgi:hypothetical protein